MVLFPTVVSDVVVQVAVEEEEPGVMDCVAQPDMLVGLELPISKFTVPPEGTAPPLVVSVIVAVNVTDAPEIEGVPPVPSVVVVASITVSATVPEDPPSDEVLPL
jgi:hypothetical protein